MKNYIFVLTLLFSSYFGAAQTPEYAYRVYFKNKTATTFSLSSPAQFLTQRSIQRREKYHIPIDSSDLPVCLSYIDSVLAVTNGTLHSVSKWQNTIVVLMTDSSLIHLANIFPFYKKSKLVAVYPNGLLRPDSASAEPKPTGFDHNYYGAAWNQISLCNGQYLHQQGLTGRGQLIAFIDAGFPGVNTISAFDSIRNSNRILDRWNFVHNSEMATDEGEHGTAVLSVVAANLPQTFVGTAPGAEIALYTSEDLNSEQPIEEDNWVAAAERADSLGADIITTSLGYNTFDPPFPDETYNQLDGKTTFVAQGANKAVTKGILVLASAGNEGITPWHYILTPGDADSALTIGAVDSSNSVFLSSSYGPNAAGILKPDVVAMGVQSAVIFSSGNVTNASGTSFATPVIAGLAACLMQADTLQTPFQIRQLIKKSADHFNQPTNQLGDGLPDFQVALNQLTSIQSPNDAGHFSWRIFPNPVNGSSLFIRFSGHHPTNFSLRLVNLNGETVLTRSFKQQEGGLLQLKLPALTTGIYFLTIEFKGKSVSKTFAKD